MATTMRIQLRQHIVASKLLDSSDQNFKEEGGIRFEETFKPPLSILGIGQWQLIGLAGRKDLRRGHFDATERVAMHSGHALFEARQEFPTSHGPGQFIEFSILLGGEILDTSRLVGGRKGLASNRHFDTHLGSLLNDCPKIIIRIA